MVEHTAENRGVAGSSPALATVSVAQTPEGGRFAAPVVGRGMILSLQMPVEKMHSDEVETDVSLVRRLLAAQFPHWADLPIAPVESAGTDNALYRLGDDMAVRLPRIHWATGQVDKEQRWLPRLAPLLPLAIPLPLGRGEPAEGYPWSWSVYGWLKGENPTVV